MAEPGSTPSAREQSTSGERTGGYMASTAKHGLIYFLGNVLSRLAGFIMLPVYTRVLTTGDYGVLEILSLSADVLGMLAGLGIRQAVVRLYYQFDAPAERNAIVSTASFLLLAIFGSITATGLLFAGQISEALLGPDQPVIYVRLAVLSFVFGALGDIPGVYLQARQRSSALVLANFLRLMLALSLNIVFVVILRKGVAGIFYSTILSALVVGGAMAVMMFRETGLRFVSKHARELVTFGAPLVVSNLGSFVLHFSNRYFLRHYHSLAVVGVFALSYKFAMLIAMFVDGPFISIWSAKALEIERREGVAAPPILRSILYHFNLVLVTAGLGMALFATDVIHLLLGAEFHAAAGPVPLLALAIVFFCYRSISQTGAMIGKRPGYIATVTTGAAVLATVLNVLLIPRWGAMGASAATAIAFALEFLFMRSLSERAFRIGIPLSETLLPLIIACASWLGAAIAVPEGAGAVTGLSIRAGAFGLYVVVLLATGIISPSARRALARSFRNPRELMTALRRA